jgi:hypothetical protein
MPDKNKFETKTVDYYRKSTVDSQLKPTAEMYILVGGSYTDASGEEHRYGHTALRIKTSQSDLTYDFGRYGNVSGILHDSGEGILRVWSSFQPYIKGEVALKRKTTAFIYAIFDYQALAVNTYFDGLIKSGKPLTEKNTSVKKVYKLKTDYQATGPNCTTLSIDGAKQAITNIDQGSDKYNKPDEVLNFSELMALKVSGGAKRLFLPANLLDYLNTQQQNKPIRIEIYGVGK